MKYKFEKQRKEIVTKLQITVDANEPVEIRRLNIQNNSDEEKTLEITYYFEPVLSRKEQDYAHQAFNNLFLIYDYDEKNGYLTIKRRARESNQKEVYLIAKLQTNCEKVGDTEFEIDKTRFEGRNNLKIPQAIQESKPLSGKVGLTTEGIVALKSTIKIKPNEKGKIDLMLSVEYDKEVAVKNMKQRNGCQRSWVQIPSN